MIVGKGTISPVPNPPVVHLAIYGLAYGVAAVWGSGRVFPVSLPPPGMCPGVSSCAAFNCICFVVPNEVDQILLGI